MSGFAGIIRTVDGIVLVSDSEHDTNQITGTYQFNKDCAAIIFRGLSGAKEFIEKYLKSVEQNDYEMIIKTAINEFNKHHKEYEKTDFSFIIATYLKPRKPKYHAFWFDANGQHCDELSEIYFFTKEHEDLMTYLLSKVYSEHILLDELANLMTFLTLQCIKIFSIGFNLTMTTISEIGVKTLTDEEMKKIFHKQEKIDWMLKKTLSDFFINKMEKDS